ncbi:MAG: GNAT family N-acetyltransferase [Oscillospiraceae bacterium]|jgi:ribosomal protein S18 acetylase RimI-like enzyme|nr:GNAT family N-acetyltransferase [Oscillospiraceae bacterium]
MNIEIRKLTPDLAEDYVRFFDVTPHNQKWNVKCYCVFWSNDDSEGKDFSSPEKWREFALQYVRNGNLQGYLAYYNDRVVGWCNANTRSDCLKCAGWRHLKDSIPIEESAPEIKIKSIFCFTVSPDMQRKGVASRLLTRVCQDAANDGFDFVEAYPEKEITAESEDFRGYVDMYKKIGFTIYHKTNEKLVMRKPLK